MALTGFPFTEQGFDDFQDAVDAAITAIVAVNTAQGTAITAIQGVNTTQNTDIANLKRFTRFDIPTEPVRVVPTIPEGTFAYATKNWSFTKAAFNMPTYGYLLASLLAANVGNAYPGTTFQVNDILDDLIERQSPVLVEVV